MSMNLLPWREAKAKKYFFKDFLKLVFIVACLALLLEAGLEGIRIYTAYFTQKTFELQKKLETKGSAT